MRRISKLFSVDHIKLDRVWLFLTVLPVEIHLFWVRSYKMFQHETHSKQSKPLTDHGMQQHQHTLGMTRYCQKPATWCHNNPLWPYPILKSISIELSEWELMKRHLSLVQFRSWRQWAFQTFQQSREHNWTTLNCAITTRCPPKVSHEVFVGVCLSTQGQ